MYGIMPLEQYVANYDSILENKPFKYGNMKGKKLDKSKFFNDYTDYEILLRNDVPQKYFKYFDDPSDNRIDDVEIGRSNKLNLSPVKGHQENGIKDSELLSKKESNSENDPTILFKNLKKSLANDENNFSLDLGELNLSNSSNRKKSLPAESRSTNPQYNFKLNNSHKFDFDKFEDFDALCEKTFKLLNKNSLVDKEGKELNMMIQSLLETLKTVNEENTRLKSNSNNLKLIIKDLNSLINSYRSKLRDYYEENRSLKAMINNEKKYNRNSKSSGSYRNYPEVEDGEETEDDLKSIEKQIYLLQVKRQRLINKENDKDNATNLSSLSEDIVRRLMKQLQDHNNHMNKNLKCVAVDETHENCPFCKKESKQSNDLLSSLLSNSKTSSLNQEEIIDLIASRIKNKLDSSNVDKNIPDIW